MIYDSIVNPMVTIDEEDVEVEQEAAPIFDENIFDVFGDSEKTQDTPKAPSKKPVKKGAAFAAAVLDRWQEQLSCLGQDGDFQQKTGLSSDWFAEVSQEFIKGASRLKLENHIAEISESALYSPNPGNFLKSIASQSASTINNFITELGQTVKERPMPEGAPKVVLSAASYPGLGIYKHWAMAFVQMFKDNVAEATADDEEGNKVMEGILKMPL